MSLKAAWCFAAAVTKVSVTCLERKHDEFLDPLAAQHTLYIACSIRVNYDSNKEGCTRLRPHSTTKNKERCEEKFGWKTICQQRENFNQIIIMELKNDAEHFYKYMRITKEQFDTLLNQLEPDLMKRHHFSQIIGPRFQAGPHDKIPCCRRLTGYQCQSPFMYQKLRSLRSLTTLWMPYGSFWKECLPKLDISQWIQIANNNFRSKWNFLNCIGSLDGKHIAIQAPNKSGLSFYN